MLPIVWARRAGSFLGHGALHALGGLRHLGEAAKATGPAISTSLLKAELAQKIPEEQVWQAIGTVLCFASALMSSSRVNAGLDAAR